MKKIITLLLVLFSLSNLVYAVMMGRQELKIDFTDKTDAQTKAAWSNPDKANITKDGLCWNERGKIYRHCWMQTVPLAVGWSWRPARAARVTAKIKPEGKPKIYQEQEFGLPLGDMFVRYSSDKKHWSSWQVMDYTKPEGGKYPAEKMFTVLIGIPQKEQEEYETYMKKYQQMDVSWGSDEEAMVKWILEQDPQFFSKNIPFMGYVQFLYETSDPEGQQITGFEAQADFAVGGLHNPPKDASIFEQRDSIPWRFEAK